MGYPDSDTAASSPGPAFPYIEVASEVAECAASGGIAGSHSRWPGDLMAAAAAAAEASGHSQSAGKIEVGHTAVAVLQY